MFTSFLYVFVLYCCCTVDFHSFTLYIFLSLCLFVPPDPDSKPKIPQIWIRDTDSYINGLFVPMLYCRLSLYCSVLISFCLYVCFYSRWFCLICISSSPNPDSKPKIPQIWIRNTDTYIIRFFACYIADFLSIALSLYLSVSMFVFPLVGFVRSASLHPRIRI